MRTVDAIFALHSLNICQKLFIRKLHAPVCKSTVPISPEKAGSLAGTQAIARRFLAALPRKNPDYCRHGIGLIGLLLKLKFHHSTFLTVWGL